MFSYITLQTVNIVSYYKLYESFESNNLLDTNNNLSDSNRLLVKNNAKNL